jgi:hypothetical protein
MEKITLLGHINQLGDHYPHWVVAVGRRANGKLVAAMRHLNAAMKHLNDSDVHGDRRYDTDNMHWEYTTLPEDYEYTKHAVEEPDFDPEEFGLFAFTADAVERYRHTGLRDYCRKILTAPIVQQAGPFTRIAIVREGELWDLIPVVLLEQMDSVENEEGLKDYFEQQIAETTRRAGRDIDFSEVKARIAKMNDRAGQQAR